MDGVTSGVSRGELWGSTTGEAGTAPGTRVPHVHGSLTIGDVDPWDRAEREAAESAALAPGATRALGAGDRRRAEEPDDLRTCFERDRDRILHSPAFRRLAGKTQVFVFPADHQRTRLTHALEVAQIATAIARATRLNVALTEAIALGHDCGHGPGGHASEDAFAPYVDGGYDHAVWGADVVLEPLNLCAETLDGVRNHSWSRPVPMTPEGVAVAFADRCGYCAHDLEDAVAAGVVATADLPPIVVDRCGPTRSRQLRSFISDIVATTTSTGIVGMSASMAEALAGLRSFNHERIYLRPASLRQARAVIEVLTALVDHFSAHPTAMGPGAPGSDQAVRRAVTYVAGMTDSFACRQAVERLGWPVERLPRGFDVTR